MAKYVLLINKTVDTFNFLISGKRDLVNNMYIIRIEKVLAEIVREAKS